MQFIITTMTIVSVVLIIAFTMIYTSTASSLNRMPGQAPIGQNAPRFERFNADTRVFIEEQRKEYAERTLSGLLVTLFITGFITLTAVFFISRFMADRAVGVIENAYTKQRQFIADASHELKTPITIIATNADAAISDQKKPSKWLLNIKDESERMGRLVSSLLQLAQLETPLEKSQFTTFDLSRTVENVIDNFLILATNKNIEIVSKVSKPLEVTSDSDKLQQLVTILIDNAIKYTKPGGKVSVTSIVANDMYKIRVSNSHPNIGEDKLNMFFDRFYQADTSHRANGHGLGLSIAKETAEQLGILLKASSSDGNVYFDINLPIKKILNQ